MKRRSRATDDEKPSKRPSATLKVGGVFAAGARRSARKSTDAPKDSKDRTSNVGPESKTTPHPTSAKSNVAQQNATDNNSSRTSREPKERTSTRTLREPKEKETKNTPDTPSAANAVTPAATPTAAGAAAPAKGAPPVGWAYEVVTSTQDLVPKKAFTINEDHNDYKCTQENCNKSFRKEKLLQSHLKHYHNISIETNDEPSSTPTTPVATPTPGKNVSAIASTPTETKRRRPQGRRSRTATGEQRPLDKSKEDPVDSITETSSSTDISNGTVIDAAEQPPAPQLQNEPKVIPPLTDSDTLKSRTPLSTLAKTSVAATQVSSAIESTPISVGTPLLRTPLYGRVGQNRFVPIPEPLVLGREKRKVVKTERMQEAESAFIKKQKTEAGPASADKKEKRRRGQGGEKEDTDEQQDISLAKPEIPSDDEATITSPKSLAPPEAKQGPETSVEKDMVHCPCGVEEESGLMMQCDLCLCWQHGSCFGLENEKHVPERYVCIACQNARRVIQKQTHQVAAFRAMADGRFPSLVPGASGHPQRFLNLTRIAETMTNLRKALRGVEIRILRVYQDTNRSLPERRALLDAAVADSECIQRQMDICEKILAAIDRPANDQGSEALILRSTVKSVLKDLWTVQRLTLFK